MKHVLDIDIAVQVGVHAAILYENILFWLRHNLANRRNIHDGKPWTFNSARAFSEQFPYFTERQIRYALEKLVKADLIIEGNFNQKKYDKTIWYSVPDLSVLSLYMTEKPVTNLSEGKKASDKIVRWM